MVNDVIFDKMSPGDAVKVHSGYVVCFGPGTYINEHGSTLALSKNTQVTTDSLTWKDEHGEKVKITLSNQTLDTGSEFITTPLVTGVFSTGDSGIFRVMLSKASIDEYRKLASQFPTVDFKMDNSKLEFVRIDGNFVFTRDKLPWLVQANCVRIYDTLEEAQSAEQEVRDLVRSRVCRSVVPDLPEKKTLGEIINKLQGIRNSVGDLDVKVRDQISQRRVIKTISDEIRRLDTQLLQSWDDKK